MEALGVRDMGCGGVGCRNVKGGDVEGRGVPVGTGAPAAMKEE